MRIFQTRTDCALANRPQRGSRRQRTGRCDLGKRARRMMFDDFGGVLSVQRGSPHQQKGALIRRYWAGCQTSVPHAGRISCCAGGVAVLNAIYPEYVYGPLRKRSLQKRGPDCGESFAVECRLRWQIQYKQGQLVHELGVTLEWN